MTRECHVRFCERLRGKLLRPTYHFGAKAHIGADADSGLVHSMHTTAANESDVAHVDRLLHGEETDVSADAGYTGVQKRREIIRAQETGAISKDVRWHIAAKRGKLKKT